MLKVYGRKLPNLNITTKVDKHLYIDIDAKDIGEILALSLPPTETYIITTKPVEQVSQLISAGYYNIAFISKPSVITETFIANFIKTDYQENYLKTVSKLIAVKYAKTGSEVENLAQALVALRDDDESTFTNIMSTNLLAFIDKLNSISELAAFCKSLQQNSAEYTEAIKKATQLESVAEKAEKYRKLYEDTKGNNSAASTEIANLQGEIESLKEQINARTVTPAEIHNSAEYRALRTRLETVTEEKSKLAEDFAQYQRDVEENAAAANSGGLEALNRQLRDELKKLKEQKLSKTIASKLPIFTNSTTLGAEHVICFKEVRPAVYTNSLIHWLDSSLRVFSASKKKSYLILVIDPLADEFAEKKYLKHGWSVGKYTDKMTVLVVPPLRFDTLKVTYHVDTYDVIICIDRCHVDVDVFDMRKAATYYLINSVNDVVDFGLDGNKCICFIEKLPASSKSPDELPIYRIPPWKDSLCTTEIKARAGKHSSDGVFISILKDNGVYWK